jgi:hypothetical protein
MKKAAAVLCVAALFILLALSADYGSANPNIVASSKDELFELKLYLDKSTYTHDEAIDCYATLEYIGADDSITVYSGDTLVGFIIVDDTYFNEGAGGYIINDVRMMTNSKKGKYRGMSIERAPWWDARHPNADFLQGVS